MKKNLSYSARTDEYTFVPDVQNRRANSACHQSTHFIG